jgi:cell division initiation protein
MDKSSDFIRNKEFHIVFKGYKPEEVDKFLDQMSFEFEKLVKRNRELAESLDKLKFEGTVEEDTDIKKIIQDALVSAHKVADEIKTQAKKEAEEMLSKQKFEGEKSLEDLKLKKMQAEQSIILLQSRYDEFKSKLNKAIDDINGFLKESDFSYSPLQEDEDQQEDNEDKIETEAESTDTEGTGVAVEAEDGSGDFMYYEQGKSESPDKQPEPVADEQPAEPQSEESEEPRAKKTLKAEKESSREPDSGSSFIQSEERESGFYFDGTVPKRERKKIDIANPDIIEDFFKASDD